MAKIRDVSKKEYEQYLNEEAKKDAELHGYIPKYKIGTWLRRNDPIAFQWGYKRWLNTKTT